MQPIEMRLDPPEAYAEFTDPDRHFLLARGRPVLARFGKYHTLSMTPSFEQWGEESALPPEVAAHCAQKGLYRVIDLSRYSSPPDLPAARTWHQDFAILRQSSEADDPWERVMREIKDPAPSLRLSVRTFYDRRTSYLQGDNGVFLRVGAQRTRGITDLAFLQIKSALRHS